MSSMIILSRPGIMVISGKVIDVDPVVGKVVIENDGIRKDQSRVKRKCAIYCSPYSVQNMKLQNGDSIMASIKPNRDMELFADGIDNGVDLFEVRGFTLRYTGSYDFPPKNNLPEEHVFSGDISLLKVLPAKDGFLYTMINVDWFKKGIRKNALLLLKGDYGVELYDVPRAIFRTGGLVKGTKPFYWIKKITLN